MENDFVIMNTSNGNLVGKVFDSWDDAQEWIDERDIPGCYEIIERD